MIAGRGQAAVKDSFQKGNGIARLEPPTSLGTHIARVAAANRERLRFDG